MADNTDLLNQIRQIVREEVETEAKTTRQDNTFRFLQLQTGLDKVANRVKDLEISTTRLEKGQEEEGKLLAGLQDGQKTLQEGQKSLLERQETLEIKIEAFHSEQTKANTEIIRIFHDTVEINAKDTATDQGETEKRVDRIEKHLNLPPLK